MDIEALASLALAPAVLAGVLKIFKYLEETAAEDTRLRVAVWLLDVKLEPAAENWAIALSHIFDSVFGPKHLSVRCLGMSAACSYASIIVILLISMLLGSSATVVLLHSLGEPGSAHFLPFFLMHTVFGNLLPDYVSVLKGRLILRAISRETAWTGRLVFLVLELLTTALLAGAAVIAGAGSQWLFTGAALGEIAENVPVRALESLYGGFGYGASLLWFLPTFATSFWIWLYCCSGGLIIAARTLDGGVAAFNTFFDIEKKPLQAIGWIAGIVSAIGAAAISLAWRLR